MAEWSEAAIKAQAQERVGRVLNDKYKLDRLLGLGGAGAVYAAAHRNGRRVAIKMLHPALSLDPGARTRFLREGYVANKVEHPGIVQILDDDIDQEGGQAFLVMELLEGETAEQWRQRHSGRMLVEDVLALSVRLLDVLEAAHAKGVVHRDLKTDNVFLTRKGVLKVLDFGIASVWESSSGRSVTVAGSQLMGTPAFMPPEQALSRWDQVDARSDIWAAGATIFTLLTNRLVHETQTFNELLLAAMTRPAPSLGEVAPHIPRRVVQVIDRALAFDKDSRWPDATSMRQAVRQALAIAVRHEIPRPGRNKARSGGGAHGGDDDATGNSVVVEKGFAPEVTTQPCLDRACDPASEVPQSRRGPGLTTVSSMVLDSVSKLRRRPWFLPTVVSVSLSLAFLLLIAVGLDRCSQVAPPDGRSGGPSTRQTATGPASSGAGPFVLDSGGVEVGSAGN